jgi:YD repeat-containing protein
MCYGYDKNGNLTSSADARGTSTYTYNTANQLASMVDLWPCPSPDRIACYITLPRSRTGRDGRRWRGLRLDGIP